MNKIYVSNIYTLDLVSDPSANKRTTLATGIIRSLCSNSSSSVRLFTFLYPIHGRTISPK